MANMAAEHPDCSYCAEGELVAKFGYKVCDLPSSKVYIFKEQSHPGRCIVAAKWHVSELTEMTPEQRAGYFDDVAKVAQAIHDIYSPDKINYGAYGDTAGHMHMHLVPKYKDGFEWAGIFAMDPNLKKLTTDEECEAVAGPIREKLQG
ncbi:MAG: HIT family protein [Lachnospiraceae bacterium]|nr:HIT family protein [Lachnospiraceae bacterium]